MKEYVILYTRSELERMLKILDINGSEVLFGTVEKIKGCDQMKGNNLTSKLSKMNLTEEELEEMRGGFK